MCRTVLAFGLAVAVASPAAAQKGEFRAELSDADSVLTLTGDAGYMPLPSMFSLYLDDEGGSRCAIHLSGFSELPNEGTFPVKSINNLKVRALCILQNREPRERLLAQDGVLVITSKKAHRLNGRFDMTLLGGITGDTFELEGTFASTLKTSI